MNSRAKNLLFWVVVGLFMILLFNLFSVPTHAPEEEVIFSDFMAKLDKGDIEKVIIKSSHVSADSERQDPHPNVYGGISGFRQSLTRKGRTD